MNIMLFLLVASVPWGIFWPSNSYGEKQVVEITFCQFSVPEDLKRSNTSFTVSYSFRVDDGGRPTDIKKVLGTEVTDDQAVPCLSEWRFPVVTPKSLLVASFRWEHGVGWSDLTVTGTEFNQRIKLKGQRCQYK